MGSIYQDPAEFPTIVGKKNWEISGRPLSPDIILGHSNTIYGTSESGKTTLVIYLMRLLAPIVGTVVIFCPSARGKNRDYDGIVPNAMIHTELDKSFFIKIAHMQEARATQYEHVENKENIKKLYSFVRSDRIDACIRNLEAMYRKAYRQKKKYSKDEKEFREEMKRLRQLITTAKYSLYKKQIMFRSKDIPVKRLTQSERIALSFIDLNPHILVIFDDCTEDLKEICNSSDPESKEFYKFYTQGRWRNITVLTISHDLGSFPKKLRANSHNSFFADSITALSFVSGNNDIAKPERDWVTDVVPEIYGRPDLHEFNKLCYCKYS
ncbi:hypothetical protein KDA11_06340, partial [Candidatus Saccharibacteria bacterium]|nr:hypothetical protein [Candidatus Saccharibacteria bacterium]